MHALTAMLNHRGGRAGGKPGRLALREIRTRMAGRATEWEVKGDLSLLRQLGLAESTGWGRGAVWMFLRK